MVVMQKASNENNARSDVFCCAATVLLTCFQYRDQPSRGHAKRNRREADKHKTIREIERHLWEVPAEF